MVTPWPENIEQILRERWPNETAAAIAADVGKHLVSVQKLARKLGLEKSDDFKRRIQQHRIDCARSARDKCEVKPVSSASEVRLSSGILTREGNVTRHRMF